MKWNKLGRLFCADHHTPDMVTGGRAPVALHLGDDTYRVYFGAYDAEMRGKVYSLDIDLCDKLRISRLITTPVLDRGRYGCFDDNGIIPSAVVRVGRKIYLYTIGFSLKNRIMFDAASGVAVSEDDGVTFQKVEGPVIDRTIYDPCFAASPDVLYDSGVFKMWYVSCGRWEPLEGGKYRHYYNIRYKESLDGLHWDVRSQVAIDYGNEHEYAISRPAVLKGEFNNYRMWYSFRAQENIATYRIGYAESQNGVQWTRMDSLMRHFDVSPEGWDSEMVCYPCVFRHKDCLYMLYNGNGYGRTGFGLAVAEA